jgi:hypothetical protein
LNWKKLTVAEKNTSHFLFRTNRMKKFERMGEGISKGN